MVSAVWIVGRVWDEVVKLMIDSEFYYFRQDQLQLVFGAFLGGKKLSSFFAASVTSHLEHKILIPFHVS